jgi:hypothetical protein
MPQIGEKYRHYKGTPYEVIGLAKHSETEEDMVIYQDIEHPEKIWARPAKMFFETVEWEGKTLPRFTLLEDYDA